MTVTPRFIIPEEEEEALGQFPRNAKESSIAEKSNSDVMITELQKKDSKADLEKDSLDAIVLQQNTEDSERRIKTLSGKDLNRDTNRREVSLGLNSAPAPSPEVAAGDRFGIKAAGTAGWTATTSNARRTIGSNRSLLDFLASCQRCFIQACSSRPQPRSMA